MYIARVPLLLFLIGCDASAIAAASFVAADGAAVADGRCGIFGQPSTAWSGSLFAFRCRPPIDDSPDGTKGTDSKVAGRRYRCGREQCNNNNSSMSMHEAAY